MNESQKKARNLPMKRTEAIRTLREMANYRIKVIAEGEKVRPSKMAYVIEELRALERALKCLLDKQLADPDGLKDTKHEDGSKPDFKPVEAG